VSLLYVDSSAMVKRLVEERESDAFEAFLRDRLQSGDVFISSALMPLELHRLAVRVGIAVSDVHTVVRNVSTVAVSQTVLDTAAGITSPIKTLDAMHMATAMILGDGEDNPGSELAAMVTYDAVMARSAAVLGMDVLSPGPSVAKDTS
jgi:uncharacterized protein